MEALMRLTLHRDKEKRRRRRRRVRRKNGSEGVRERM
jgi:hypothetical protein